LIDGGTGRMWKEELEAEDAGGGLAVSVNTANVATSRAQQAKLEVYVRIGIQQHAGWVSRKDANQNKSNYTRRNSRHLNLPRILVLLRIQP
jgi:hypothetical protein